MAPCELGDHRSCATGVRRKLPLESLGGDSAKKPTVLVSRRYRKRISQPSRGVIDENIDWAELGLRSVEQAPRRLRIGQIGFGGSRQPTLLADIGDDVLCIARTIPAVCLECVGIIFVQEPKVGDEHTSAAISQDPCGGGPDAMVSTSNERNVVGQIE